MRRMLSLIFSVGLLALFVSGSAHAYQWQRKSAPASPLFPTVKAACQSGGGSPFDTQFPESKSEFGCCVKDMTGWCYTSFSVVRVGSCEGTYNTADGSCTPPPEPEPPNQCETTNGQTVSHEHLMKSAVGQPTIDPPGSVCGNGCQYAFTYTPASNVYVYSSGNPPGVFGIYSYTGNGIECTENTLQTPGNPSEGETQDPDDTPPPEDGDKCPAGYIYNGTFCSPENPPEEPDPTDPTDPADPENPTDPDDGSGGGGGGGGDDGGSGDGGDDGSDDGTGGGEGDGSGGGTGGSGDGSGEGDGEEGEEDSGSGPGFCDGDDCSFVAPTYFDGAETVPGFEESLAHVFDGIRSSPLGSAVGAISFPSGSGVCPSGTVMLFGRPITFDGHCTLWGEISGIFSALMLAVWCLLGVRIVLSS
ncbi:methyltransferase [Stutzerimonas balearica]|uniref:methyltransferase n=1 Tax=Stutzerimonas balearica TaxID=74829 RepID=UPI00190D3A4D|nr:methyltransferase [Stutzerimonas balearica]MBK3824657.1 methyltransferase [Stutzerimonas balearica]MBK3854348.1 methyltransferase [Stutzerimonas balearica]